MKKAVKAEASNVQFEELPKDVQKKLKPVLTKYLDHKAGEKKMKAQADELAVDLEMAYRKHGIKSVIYMGMAVIFVESAGRKSLDQKKAMELLAAKGVPLKVIEDAFKGATKAGEPYSFMQTREAGKGGEDE